MNLGGVNRKEGR